jgi:repressor LexA
MLTRRQSDLLQFMRNYGQEHDGIMPSFREMAAGMGCAVSHAHKLLAGLEERGFVRRLRNRARAFELVPEGASRRFEVRFVKCSHCRRMTAVWDEDKTIT